MLPMTADEVDGPGLGHADEAAPLILVVDDDAYIQDLLEDLFTAAGYRVECVADGLAALARIRAGGIDLAILDLMLPGLDGIQLCEEARAVEGQPYLPIILLTGRGDRDQRLAGFAAGADDYLTKPFDL